MFQCRTAGHRLIHSTRDNSRQVYEATFKIVSIVAKGARVAGPRMIALADARFGAGSMVAASWAINAAGTRSVDTLTIYSIANVSARTGFHARKAPSVLAGRGEAAV
jgi:hypothetical protein